MKRYRIYVAAVILVIAALLALHKLPNRASSDGSSAGAVSTSADTSSKSFPTKSEVSPEKRSKNYWNRMRAITQTQLSDIHFFGRVIDQDNHPVTGAVVEFHANSGYLAAGSGTHRITTDTEGLFEITGVHGDGFSIRSITCPNYDFRFADSNIREFENYQRFDYSAVWGNFTRDNPYVYRMWKVERYEQVKEREELGFGLLPDGRAYILNLTTDNENILEESAIGNGQLAIAITRNDGEWSLLLKAINGGGIAEANGIYMNRAPQSGYQQTLVYRGKRTPHTEIAKSLYIKSKDGYARLQMIFHPYYKGDKAVLHLKYAVNLEHGVELSVPRAPEEHSFFDVVVQ